MFKYLLLALLLVSVTFAEVSKEDSENFAECLSEIKYTCDESVETQDYDECKVDDDEDVEDWSGAEYFGKLKDCYNAVADDLDGDCKKMYQAMADCNGSVLGFALALLALVALLI
ncbi:hypothetical protein PPERSA_05167 [Pseudocohnilembus persalinus]|uniref:Uncharacterized protein n=1 Tax=Pseudocohnilembus persalinus TaxID=266149 RepID=A0A0V0R9D4_PSEPJ|nr:hypothetical protein PPERSA_05167 [Pseudocohnilembus persalinus]|eukprot:KRX11058.1 hypothetical protein PPERSA_05167 [Pseudocohnilembus persalinus]